MGGIAQLAKQKGFKVTGSDKNCYPPMSTQLEQAGIQLIEGFSADNLKSQPDCVVVGNAMSRGNEEVEAMLNQGLNYRSGPQWLAENILQDKWVIAVAGTHGKTTTSSMVAWLLEYAGYNPSFLIGGVPENFGVSARLTDSVFFVVEADEYDTAFFDKRSKFVHYRARTTILNNLEFDHADIFVDLAAIQTQFHHLVRTIAGNGLVIHPYQERNIDDVLDKGCWTPKQSFGDKGDWQFDLKSPDGSVFEVMFKGKHYGKLNWNLIGLHNVKNGIAAIAAAHHVGVQIEDAIAGLSEFKNVKRRMELKISAPNVEVYDDFAHHPTAIELTLDGLRKQVGDQPIIAVVDVRSNTMKMGVHKAKVIPALAKATHKLLHDPQQIDWPSLDNTHVFDDVTAIEAAILELVKGYQNNNQSCHVLLMSNGAFGGIYQSLAEKLKG